MDALVTPTKAKKVRKYQYETIRVRKGSRPTPSSKYDFVKVKVWLQDHYYILSRFLVSRVLNVTKVDQIDAVKIALELKKRLVDQGLLNVSQAEMENQLFQILKGYGYGNEYIERYRITTKFHHQRVPLIILITGTRCVGKSWMATQLAERLNLSTVLQTSLVYDLMYSIMRDLPSSVSSPYPPPDRVPLIYRDMDSPTLINEYKKECHMIREGVETDIQKCFEEGKAIIIEGANLDPMLFIELLQLRNIPTSTPLPPLLSPNFTSPPSLHEPPNSQPTPLATIPESLPESLSALELSTPYETSKKNPSSTPPAESSPSSQPPSLSSSPPKSAPSSSNGESLPPSPSTPLIPPTLPPAPPEGTEKEPAAEKKEKKKGAGSARGIIVPFVLSVKNEDHQQLVENWLSCSPRDQEFVKQLGKDAKTQAKTLVDRLQRMQDYLLQNVPPFHRVDVNIHSFPDTLNVLHSAVLDRIQQVYADGGFGE